MAARFRAHERENRPAAPEALPASRRQALQPPRGQVARSARRLTEADRHRQHARDHCEACHENGTKAAHRAVARRFAGRLAGDAAALGEGHQAESPFATATPTAMIAPMKDSRLSVLPHSQSASAAPASGRRRCQRLQSVPVARTENSPPAAGISRQRRTPVLYATPMRRSLRGWTWPRIATLTRAGGLPNCAITAFDLCRDVPRSAFSIFAVTVTIRSMLYRSYSPTIVPVCTVATLRNSVDSPFSPVTGIPLTSSMEVISCCGTSTCTW